MAHIANHGDPFYHLGSTTFVDRLSNVLDIEVSKIILCGIGFAIFLREESLQDVEGESEWYIYGMIIIGGMYKKVYARGIFVSPS